MVDNGFFEWVINMDPLFGSGGGQEGVEGQVTGGWRPGFTGWLKSGTNFEKNISRVWFWKNI